nr:unnamed protein product [Digitaria exilis]
MPPNYFAGQTPPPPNMSRPNTVNANGPRQADRPWLQAPNLTNAMEFVPEQPLSLSTIPNSVSTGRAGPAVRRATPGGQTACPHGRPKMLIVKRPEVATWKMNVAKEQGVQKPKDQPPRIPPRQVYRPKKKEEVQSMDVDSERTTEFDIIQKEWKPKEDPEEIKPAAQVVQTTCHSRPAAQAVRPLVQAVRPGDAEVPGVSSSSSSLKPYEAQSEGPPTHSMVSSRGTEPISHYAQKYHTDSFGGTRRRGTEPVGAEEDRRRRLTQRPPTHSVVKEERARNQSVVGPAPYVSDTLDQRLVQRPAEVAPPTNSVVPLLHPPNQSVFVEWPPVLVQGRRGPWRLAEALPSGDGEEHLGRDERRPTCAWGSSVDDEELVDYSSSPERMNLIKTNMTVSGIGGGEPIGAKGVISMELTIGSKTLATAFFNNPRFAASDGVPLEVVISDRLLSGAPRFRVDQKCLSWSKSLVRKWFNIRPKAQDFHADSDASQGMGFWPSSSPSTCGTSSGKQNGENLEYEASPRGPHVWRPPREFQMTIPPFSDPASTAPAHAGQSPRADQGLTGVDPRPLAGGEVLRLT